MSSKPLTMREKRSHVVHILDIHYDALVDIKDRMQEKVLKVVSVEELVQDALETYIKGEKR